MKAILIFSKLILINVDGNEKSPLAGKIVSISTTKTCTLPLFQDEVENVPEYNYISDNSWNRALKNFPIIDLKDNLELLSLYNRVHNYLIENDDSWHESESEFLFSHVNDYWR